MHDPRGVAQVEHRRAPHLPVRIARVRVISELDAQSPLLVECVLHLFANLFIGEVRKKREGALGNAHDEVLQVAVAVAT